MYSLKIIALLAEVILHDRTLNVKDITTRNSLSKTTILDVIDKELIRISNEFDFLLRFKDCSYHRQKTTGEIWVLRA